MRLLVMTLLAAVSGALSFSPPAIVSDSSDGSLSIFATAVFTKKSDGNGGNDGGGRCRIDTLCTAIQEVKDAQETAASTVAAEIKKSVAAEMAAIETRLGARLDAIESRVAKLEDGEVALSTRVDTVEADSTAAKTSVDTLAGRVKALEDAADAGGGSDAGGDGNGAATDDASSTDLLVASVALSGTLRPLQKSLFATLQQLVTPTDSLELWLAADRIKGVRHGGELATWGDVSGKNRHAKTTNKDHYPTYLERFDAANSWPVFEIPPLATKNLFSRDDRLLASSYADARCIDAGIVSKAGCKVSSRCEWNADPWHCNNRRGRSEDGHCHCAPRHCRRKQQRRTLWRKHRERGMHTSTTLAR